MTVRAFEWGYEPEALVLQRGEQVRIVVDNDGTGPLTITTNGEVTANNSSGCTGPIPCSYGIRASNGGSPYAVTSATVTTNAATTGDALGERIYVFGRVLDENARPVPHALIEVWQANAAGRYAHVRDGYLAPLDPNFSGCGRCVSDADGRYLFRTIKPGPYPWPNNGSDWRPAHIHLSIFGEAFAQRLITQLYFEGDPLIPLCPIVNTIADKSAVDRLVARLDLRNQEPFDCLAYRFDIVLRGRRQTHFENRPEGL